MVTIDEEEAFDHDDAIYAEPHESGWRIVVAIADVSYFVKPGDEIDTQARIRGNSIYLPERVIPMLPEKLSKDLCSLNEQAERPCLAVELVIDKSGKLINYKFSRAMMKSAGRLTYQGVQAVKNKILAVSSEHNKVIHDLYGAYAALKQAREDRGALEIHTNNEKVQFSEGGKAQRILIRPRDHSHRLVEEMMILQM